MTGKVPNVTVNPYEVVALGAIVQFGIDADGILSVTAVDKGIGKKQDIAITSTSTLPSEKVDRMVNEAENFAKGRQGNEGCHRHKEPC
uniref:Heat shock protein 70 n=1 Tax=Quercus lobata TaxID=97700 RepID=A0A7N2LMC3_QUELO